jgi:preprotein translocase subunit SecG
VYAIVFTFLGIVQFLVSIALILVVLMQKSTAEGMGAIGGSAQMFFDKAKGIDETLEKATKYLAVVFMVLSVVLAIIL